MKSRKSVVKKLFNEQNSTNSERYNLSSQIIKCPCTSLGCNYVSIGTRSIISHIENECIYFISKASRNFKEKIDKICTNKDRETLSRLFINKVKSTPEIESYDRSFKPEVMEKNYSLTTKKADRFKKATVFKKLDLIRELDEGDEIDLSNVPMKSHLVCVFFTIKFKIARTFICYRSVKNFDIIVKEINGSVTKKLEGHKDHISEIRSFKNDKEETFIYSSSLDNFCILWHGDNLTMLYKFDFGTWIFSSSISIMKKLNCTWLFCAGGYYKKYPIKIFSVNTGKFEYQINITENMSSEILESYVDEESGKYYCFVGSDNCDKPKVLWLDFKNNVTLGSFPALSNVTSLIVEYFNKSLCILYSDSSGVIRQADLTSSKLIMDFKSNSTIIDLCVWDAEYLIACGNPKDNSIKIYTKTKTRLVKSFENSHSKVVCNISKTFNHNNGFVLVSVGGDRKFKMLKLI